MSDELPDILDHYTLVNDQEGHLGPHNVGIAMELAGQDSKRVWYVRDSDGCDCDEDDDECHCTEDEVWSVEPWHGQFVNCLGFFVTTEPRKPEHDDTLFIY